VRTCDHWATVWETSPYLFKLTSILFLLDLLANKRNILNIDYGEVAISTANSSMHLQSESSVRFKPLTKLVLRFFRCPV